MEDRIASQRKDRKPEDVVELFLDNVQSSSINGLSKEYSSLQKLSIVHCGLTSLEGLPPLPALEKLLLSDNRLTGGLDVLTECPTLRKLALAGNKIASLDELKPLSKLTSLESLDLYNCPVTSLENYREQVFELLTSLNSLDGLDRSGEEVEDSEGEEEEEAEEDGESDSDEEPGLDYLLNNEIDSESSGSENEYDPDADEPPPDDDFIVPSDDEEREDGAGPSQAKRPRLDPQPEPTDSDSN